MKKRILIYILFAAIALPFIGCEKEYEDESRITFFPDMTINGEEMIFLPTGSDYVDEGAVSSEKGEPIDIVTVSDLDVTTPGSYSIKYTSVNSDGFSKTVLRNLIVYEANVNTEDISGSYTGSVLRNGSEGYNSIPITLTKQEGLDGIYKISDWISGFYAVGRDYGEDYSFVGLIQINAMNEVFLLSESNIWNDPLFDVSGTYDPMTQTISYSAFWADGDYEFVVELVKN